MGTGIIDLIQNSLAMKRHRQNEKDQEAMHGLVQSLYSWANPSIQSDQNNAKQDIDYYLGELVGPGYKDHQPFIMNALHGVGNAILGSMGAQLPQKRLPQIPVMPAQQGGQAPPQQNFTPANYTPVPRPGAGTSLAALAPGAPATTPRTVMGQPVSAVPVPVGKDRGAPTLAPISQDTMRDARLADLEASGKFGKESQAAQQHLMTLAQAVRRGEMTPEELKENMRQFLSSQPTAAAAGTERDIYVRFPDQPAYKDPTTGVQVPAVRAHTETFQFNSRTQQLSQYGQNVPWSSVQQRGGRQTQKPGVDRTISTNAAGRNKAVQDYYAAHPELGPPPGPKDIVRVDKRVSGETGDEEIVNAMIMPEPQGASRTTLAQLQAAAASRYYRVGPDGKPQRLSKEESDQIGSDMYINFENLRAAREQQQMGRTQFETGVPAGLGIETISLPPGVQRIQGSPLTFEQVQAMGQEPAAGATPAPVQPAQQPLQPGGAPPAVQGQPATGAPAQPPAQTTPQQPAARPAQQGGAQYGPMGVPQLTQQAQEQNAINQYLAKINGQGGFNAAGAEQGALLLQQRTGLTAGQLDEAASEYIGNKKSIQQNQEQSAGMLRFVDAVDLFADQFTQAARQVPDARSEFANSIERDFLSKFYSNPRLRSMHAAGLALDRAWSGITSNAYQSRAQLPQGALKATMDSINDKMTFPEMMAVAQRVKTEGATERYTFAKQLWDIKKKQEANPIGQATGFTAGPPPTLPRELSGKPQAGESRQIRLKGSDKVVTVYYDPVRNVWTSQKPQGKQ